MNTLDKTPIQQFEEYVAFFPTARTERWQYYVLENDTKQVRSYYNVVVETTSSEDMSRILARLGLLFPETKHWELSYSNLHLERTLLTYSERMLCVTTYPMILRTFLQRCEAGVRPANYYVRVMNIYSIPGDSAISDVIKYHGTLPRDMQ